MQNHSILIIFSIFIFGNVHCDFYMFGSRYYNSDECWSTSYLSSFQYNKSPLENPDELIKMTMRVTKTNAVIDVGAYFTSTNKAGLADAHEFFKGIKELPKQEKRYFPQKMDCFKEVNNWFYGFGFYDFYGIAYQLNPTISDYLATSPRGRDEMDFIDLFSIFLDIFRAFKVVFAKDYYIGDFGEDDIGINFFTEEDKTTTIQGRIRTLHDFKKGSRSSKCIHASMKNFQKHKELYLANTGKKKIPRQTIETCQNLNIAGALEVFTLYASKAVSIYYPDKDANFEHCFNETYYMPKRCPEPLKPIWDDKTNRYLYWSIRNVVLKWTSESMVDHLITLFELMRDKEINRLAMVEKERLLKMEQQQKEQEKALKEKQKQLMKMVAESIHKIKVKRENEEAHVNDSHRSTQTSQNSADQTNPTGKLSEDQSQVIQIHKKVADEDRSETTEDFLGNFNVESVRSSEISETILQEEKMIQDQVKLEQMRIREAMKKLLEQKLVKKVDEDEDVMETGEVKNSLKKIVETTQDALVLDEQREEIINAMRKNLENQIENIRNNEKRRLEIKRMDSIQEIMEMKQKIDVLKEEPNTLNNRRKLDEEVRVINEKLDQAIVKYGSDKEIVDTKQVVITLGSLKRELDPYYLKKNIKTYGTLNIQNQENDFIFL